MFSNRQGRHRPEAPHPLEETGSRLCIVKFLFSLTFFWYFKEKKCKFKRNQFQKERKNRKNVIYITILFSLISELLKLLAFLVLVEFKILIAITFK